MRRPQLLLVRDLIFSVLHPMHLAMPELNGASALSDKVSGEFRYLSTLVHLPFFELVLGDFSLKVGREQNS